MEKSEAIRQFGESGFLTQLALAEGVELEWPELTLLEDSTNLMKNFGKDEVYLFFFLRSAASWFRVSEDKDFDRTISKAAQATNKRVPGTPSSIAEYASTYEKVFGRKLGKPEMKSIERAAAPVYHDSVINDIARASSRARNERIVTEAERLWLEGKSIFMLFGTAHAVIQEKALRSLAN